MSAKYENEGDLAACLEAMVRYESTPQAQQAMGPVTPHNDAGRAHYTEPGGASGTKRKLEFDDVNAQFQHINKKGSVLAQGVKGDGRGKYNIVLEFGSHREPATRFHRGNAKGKWPRNLPTVNIQMPYKLNESFRELRCSEKLAGAFEWWSGQEKYWWATIVGSQVWGVPNNVELGALRTLLRDFAESCEVNFIDRTLGNEVEGAKPKCNAPESENHAVKFCVTRAGPNSGRGFFTCSQKGAKCMYIFADGLTHTGFRLGGRGKQHAAMLGIDTVVETLFR